MTNQEKIHYDLSLLHQNVQKLNEQWNIIDTPVQSHVPILGGVITLFKRCIRKSVYWFLRPYWEQQIAFNTTVTAAISDLYRIQCSFLEVSAQDAPAILEDPLLSETGPRIIQLVSSLNYGDAVGNEVIAFKRTLMEHGYPTEIYANHIHKKLPPSTARFYKNMPALRSEDIVIYHFASECDISRDIKNFPCKVILRYHNITPPRFFHGYDANAEKATANGLQQVKQIMPYIHSCLPVSSFNQKDLEAMGYTCPMEVLPILIRFDDYAQTPNQEVIDQYSKDGRTNILFVGRMAPNKKVEDVISVFAYYKEHYDPEARLFLVGSFSENDKYYRFLCKHLEHLGVKDVIFPGHISFASILSYYRIAHLFLCLSEHEGFCVPLVEAMYFDVPILAYESCAIPDTLNHCGLLVHQKDTPEIAKQMDNILKNPEKKAALLEGQRKRLSDFDLERLKKIFVQILEKQI